MPITAMPTAAADARPPPPGAPRDNTRQHGRYSTEAIARRLEIRELLQAVKALASTVGAT